MLVGSLREDGYSARLAAALARLALDRLDFVAAPIRALPLYDPGLELDPPAAWQGFRAAVRSADAVLFVTPEYNRSIPGSLKNAIDIGSRPYGESVFFGRPAAVVSQSPGALGGFGAHHAVRQTLVSLGMPTLPQPEVYLGGAGAILGPGGTILDEGARTFLESFVHAFAAWIARFASRDPL